MLRATTTTGPRPRPALLLTVLLVVAGMLTGCGDIDHGDQLARDFRSWMKDVDGVAGTQAGGRNTLPWSGTASATVTLAPDLPADGVQAVAERANEFPARDEVAVRVVHEVAGATGTFVVPRGAAAVEATVRAVREVISVPDVVSVDLERGEALDDEEGFTATVVTRGLVPGTADAVGPPLAVDALDVARVVVTDEAGAVVARFTDLRDLDGPRAALTAVAAAYRVTGAELAVGTLVVRVDAPRGAEVAALAGAAAPDVDVTVQFGAVTTGAAGDYRRAHAVSDAALATGLVVAVTAEPDAVEIEVADVAGALAVDPVLRGLPEAEGVRVTYTTTDGVAYLVTPSAGLAPSAAALAALVEGLGGRVEELRLRDGGLDVHTVAAGTPTEAVADARAAGRACALLPDGVDVSVFLGPVGFAVGSQPSLRRADLDVYDAQDETDPVLDAFVEGWSTAP